eukprot:scaffold232383_cov18-Tisochrysis_lutea.AAC.2
MKKKNTDAVLGGTGLLYELMIKAQQLHLSAKCDCCACVCAEEKMALQTAQCKTEMPVLRTEDCYKKRDTLERVCKPIATKPAPKPAAPPPQPQAQQQPAQGPTAEEGLVVLLKAGQEPALIGLQGADCWTGGFLNASKYCMQLSVRIHDVKSEWPIRLTWFVSREEGKGAINREVLVL